MSRRVGKSATDPLPSVADCTIERGFGSIVDPTGTNTQPPPSGSRLVRLADMGRPEGGGETTPLSIALAVIDLHRRRLTRLIDDWRSATLDAPLTDRLSNRAREKAGHAIIELAPSLGRRRLWRVDGVTNARKEPILATGGEGCGSNWRLVVDGWPLLAGGVGVAGVVALATDALAAAELTLGLLDAHAAIVATGVANDPRHDGTRTMLEGIAHHDAAVRPRPDDEPTHLRPATMILAPTPWSKASLRHRFPHRGRDVRGKAPKLPSKDFVVPGGVTLTISDEILSVAPMRALVGPNPDPVARLRAIAALSEGGRP